MPFQTFRPVWPVLMKMAKLRITVSSSNGSTILQRKAYLESAKGKTRSNVARMGIRPQVQYYFAKIIPLFKEKANAMHLFEPLLSLRRWTPCFALKANTHARSREITPLPLQECPLPGRGLVKALSWITRPRPGKVARRLWQAWAWIRCRMLFTE